MPLGKMRSGFAVVSATPIAFVAAEIWASSVAPCDFKTGADSSERDREGPRAEDTAFPSSEAFPTAPMRSASLFLDTRAPDKGALARDWRARTAPRVKAGAATETVADMMSSRIGMWHTSLRECRRHKPSIAQRSPPVRMTWLDEASRSTKKARKETRCN